MPGSLCVVTLKAFAALVCSPLGMVSIDSRGILWPIFIVKVRDTVIEDAAIIGKQELFGGRILQHLYEFALVSVQRV